MTDRKPPEVPPMPEARSYFSATANVVDWPNYCTDLETWGRQCAEIAQAQARRADEAERTLWQTVDERDEAYATLAQRDREVLGLRQVLENLRANFCAMTSSPIIESWIVMADTALAAIAQAGAEAERRIREDEGKRIIKALWEGPYLIKMRMEYAMDDPCPEWDDYEDLDTQEKFDRLKAAILGTGWEAVDLSKCPKCGGPADNGHDRCLPPNPYFCTKCSGEAR